MNRTSDMAEAAYKLVKIDGISLRAAGKKLGVSRTTIQKRVREHEETLAPEQAAADNHHRAVIRSGVGDGEKTINTAAIKGLSPGQVSALGVLVNAGSVKDAAGVAGVKPDTIRRWVRDESHPFRVALDEAKSISLLLGQTRAGLMRDMVLDQIFTYVRDKGVNDKNWGFYLGLLDRMGLAQPKVTEVPVVGLPVDPRLEAMTPDELRAEFRLLIGAE